MNFSHWKSNNWKWSSNLYQVKFLQISAVLCLNMISCKFCNRSKWGMKRSLTLILFLWSTLLVLDICLAENLAIELSTWHQLKVARRGKRRGKDIFWVTLSGLRTDWSKRKIVMRLGTGWPNAVQCKKNYISLGVVIHTWQCILIVGLNQSTWLVISTNSA